MKKIINPWRNHEGYNCFGCSPDMKTEKEKMLTGEVYSAVDPQLIEELTEVKEIIQKKKQ